jgi:hypothetical protein
MVGYQSELGQGRRHNPIILDSHSPSQLGSLSRLADLKDETRPAPVNSPTVAELASPVDRQVT